MKYLYKYSSIENAIKSLEGEYIYLSSPKDFNDLFDSSLGFNEEAMKKLFITLVSSHQIINGKSFIDIAKGVFPFSEFPTHSLEEQYDFIEFFLSENNFKFLENFGNENQNEMIDKILDKAVEITGLQPTENDIKAYDKFRSFNFLNFLQELMDKYKVQIQEARDYITGYKFKIGCLTEVKNSNYMWALYASNFKGVCLEYDYEELNKDADNEIYQINYSSVRPILLHTDIIEYINNLEYKDKFEQKIMNIYTTKFIEFSNEREWRIIKVQEAREFKTKALRKIILGYNLKEETKEVFKKYALKLNVEIEEIDYSSDSYELNFKKAD